MAFDAAVKTATRPNGSAGDAVTPSLRLLNMKAMSTTTALSGTDGTDAKIIHGDRWQQIDKNETKFIDINLMTTIEGNEKRMLVGNLETSVMQTTKDDRFGTHLANFYDISTFNYFHQRHEQHSDVEQEVQKTQHLEVTDGVSKVEKEHHESINWKTETTGFFAGATGVKVEGLGAGAETFGAKSGIGLTEINGLAWKHRAEAISDQLSAFMGRLVGAEVESGGPATAIRPVFVGILVAVHIDSPFA